jgi:Utp13 specific WD40 associated domain
MEVPGVAELLEGLIAYTQRHYARVDRLVRSSFLLDLTLASMNVLQPSEEGADGAGEAPSAAFEDERRALGAWDGAPESPAEAGPTAEDGVPGPADAGIGSRVEENGVGSNSKQSGIVAATLGLSENEGQGDQPLRKSRRKKRVANGRDSVGVALGKSIDGIKKRKCPQKKAV